MKSLLLELKKTKHHKMYLISLALLLIQYLWTLYAEGKNKDLVQGWFILFYDFPLLNSIMVPTFIAIMASRLIDIEHKGTTWKLLGTLQSKTNIFFGKVIYGFCFLLCFCLLQLIMILLLGRNFGYYGNPDLWACALYFIQTLAISFLLFLLQMTLSILFTNQAVSISVGICGSMAGLFLMFVPWTLLQQLLPWGHFGAAMFVGMDWDAATRDCTYYYSSRHNHMVLVILVWIILLLYTGWKLFLNMDTEGYHWDRIIHKHSKSRKASPIRIPRLPVEVLKIKRSPVWIAFFILPAISAFVGTFNYLGNLGILKDGWYSLWTQHSLFLCYFFMPALIGVYASYLWRMEHTGTNWNMLMVNTSAPRLVFDKIATCSVMTLITIIWTTGLYLACGFLCKLLGTIPVSLLEWNICGFLGGITVSALQCFLSLIIRSFAIPIGIALAGGIAGLVATAMNLWYLVPYALFAIGMRANNPKRELNLIVFVLLNVFFTLLFYRLSVLYLKKTDIQTNV